MTDEYIELAIEVPAETKVAVERAAAAQGVSVSEFVENAVQKMLAGAGCSPHRAGTN
jgi:uncharacterized protein (DUF1778 family)